MTEFYFSVGLTDVGDYEGFVYNTESDIPDVMTSYNIRKASTEIEQASIQWKLNTNLPATLNVIALWENIIRRPHLNMVGINAEPMSVSQDYKSYSLSIDYINLIPLNSSLVQEFQSSDYDALTLDLEFGDLCLNDFYNYQEQGLDWMNSLIKAYQDNDVSNLGFNTMNPIVLPRFQANFQLRQYSYTPDRGSRARFNKWAEDNREVLTAKGYILGSNACKVGSLPLGKLVGDPWEEYQKLQAYPRVCRTSITKTE